jgi:hypothetical protein
MDTGLRRRDKADATRLDRAEVTEAEAKMLTWASPVERLVAGGISRLSAERIVEIEQGSAEPGRARRHTQARH